MKVVVHIGLPKTGTSAIQSHLSTNRHWLSQHGVVLPRSGFHPGYGHAFLISRADVSNPSGEMAPFLVESGQLHLLSQEISRLKSAGVDQALLSWEGFALMDAELVRKLCACFDGCRIEVLCYIRKQSELFVSRELQATESGRRPAVRLFNTWQGPVADGGGYFDFFSLLNRWAAIIGDRGHIHTRVFGKRFLAGEDIVTDFLAALGLEDTKGFILQKEEINASLDQSSAAVVGLLETVGINGRQRHKLVHALMGASARQEESLPSLFPPARMREISESFLASNRSLLEQFPPANCPSDLFEQEFLSPVDEHASVADPVVALCTAAVAGLNRREAMTWHGKILSGHDLNNVTAYAGTGWRDSEASGIWSVGERSEIAFLLPGTSLDQGPRECRIMSGGQYFGSNERTLVKGSGVEAQIDLRSGEIRVPITGEILCNGIRLELLHENPVSPAESGTGTSEDRLAFKLESLCYELCP